MKAKWTIFYSWQSDLPNKSNRSFIEKSIQKALKKVQKVVELEICLDRDTQNVSGAPDIANTIFEKILQADLFVADVTPINWGRMDKLLRRRPTPNPNVLLELGFAIRRLGWDRILLVVNSKYCKIEELPFDIRARRIVLYNSAHSESSSAPTLDGLLASRIKEALDSPDARFSPGERDAAIQHDVERFRKIDAQIPESRLMAVLDWVETHSIYRDGDTKELFALAHEKDEVSGQFIDPEVNSKWQTLLGAINAYIYFLSLNFFPTKEARTDTYVINFYSESELNPTPRFQNLQALLFEKSNAVRECYRDFRFTVKASLMV